MKKAQLIEMIQTTRNQNYEYARRTSSRLDEQYFCGRFSALDVVLMILKANKIEEDEE